MIYKQLERLFIPKLRFYIGPFGAMIGSAVIGAAGSIGGSLLGNSASAKNVASANAANAAMTDKGIQHSKYQMSMAHQLQVRDLRRAGLNPILSANSGASGGMPSMGTMQPVQESYGDLGASAFNTFKTAVEERKLIKEQQQTQRTQQSANEQLANKASQEAKKLHWEGLNASYEAFKNSLTKSVYEGETMQEILPVLRALSESGARPDVLAGSSAKIISDIFGKKFKPKKVKPKPSK